DHERGQVGPVRHRIGELGVEHVAGRGARGREVAVRHVVRRREGRGEEPGPAPPPVRYGVPEPHSGAVTQGGEPQVHALSGADPTTCTPRPGDVSATLW